MLFQCDPVAHPPRVLLSGNLGLQRQSVQGEWKTQRRMALIFIRR